MYIPCWLDAHEIKARPGHNKSMPVMIRYGSYRIKNCVCTVHGADATMRDVLKVDLLYGRLLNHNDTSAGRDVVVISAEFAEMVYTKISWVRR